MTSEVNFEVDRIWDKRLKYAEWSLKCYKASRLG